VFCFFAVLGDAIFRDVVQANFASFQIFGGLVFVLIGLQFVFRGPAAIEMLQGVAASNQTVSTCLVPVMLSPTMLWACFNLGYCDASTLGNLHLYCCPFSGNSSKADTATNINSCDLSFAPVSPHRALSAVVKSFRRRLRLQSKAAADPVPRLPGWLPVLSRRCVQRARSSAASTMTVTGNESSAASSCSSNGPTGRCAQA
jgi:hypothetical protein